MILQCSLGASLIFTEGMVDEAREALTRGLSLARTFTDFDYQQRTMHKLWLFSFCAAAFDVALCASGNRSHNRPEPPRRRPCP